jgi:hypothetical protein
LVSVLVGVLVMVGAISRLIDLATVLVAILVAVLVSVLVTILVSVLVAVLLNSFGCRSWSGPVVLAGHAGLRLLGVVWAMPGDRSRLGVCGHAVGSI